MAEAIVSSEVARELVAMAFDGNCYLVAKPPFEGGEDIDFPSAPRHHGDVPAFIHRPLSNGSQVVEFMCYQNIKTWETDFIAYAREQAERLGRTLLRPDIFAGDPESAFDFDKDDTPQTVQVAGGLL